MPRSVKKCTVYGLLDMSIGEIRYAGQTTRTTRKRFSEHIERARQGYRTPVHCWIKSVLDRGGEIGIVPLVENALLHETEIEVIARLKDEGCDLLNLTQGGEGTLGWSMSDDQRERCAERMRERYEDPEIRERNAALLRAITADPEWRRQHSQRIAALWDDETWRAQMMKVRASCWTADRRAARREMLILLWKNPGYRSHQVAQRRRVGADPAFVAKMCEVNREINSRPEVRSKRSVISRSYWSDPEVRAAQSLRLRGVPKSEAAKAAYRDAWKVRPRREYSAEERQKLSETASAQWKGTRKSEEHKRKIAESNRRTKALRKAEREAAERARLPLEKQSIEAEADQDRTASTLSRKDTEGGQLSFPF